MHKMMRDDWTEPELSSQSNLRRRLLTGPAPTPTTKTTKLDLQNKKNLT